MNFGAKAASYIDAFMDIIRWSNADRLLNQLSAPDVMAGVVATMNAIKSNKEDRVCEL